MTARVLEWRAAYRRLTRRVRGALAQFLAPLFTWPPGIRARLAALYTAICALLILLLGGVFYAGLQHQLSASFDTALHVRAEQIAAGISLDGGRLSIEDVAGDLPGLNAASGSQPPGSGQPAGSESDTHVSTAGSPASSGSSTAQFGSLVRILDAQGRSVYVSPAFRGLTMPTSSVSGPLGRGSAWQGTVTARDGQSVRLYSVALVTTGAPFGLVQVGEPLTSLTSTLHTTALSLFVLAPFALAGAALCGYWLSGRALRPVVALTRAARLIEAEDLHRRVVVPAPRDEIRELALTLNEMIERLERAFRVQQRFVADASHELRSPVAAIRSMTEVAIERRGPADEVSVLRQVNAEAERLGELIGDLLALARADEGHVALDHAPVRLDHLAEDAAAVAEPLARARGIQLDVRVCRPVVVIGDEARLIQVLMNLLDNAISSTEPQGVVRIAVDTDGEQARLIVRDTGCGIAVEHLPHIFERFYRADPGRSRSEGHTGLGLAIVDWVVRAHHGSIAVESVIGQGATFTVLLPCPHVTP